MVLVDVSGKLLRQSDGTDRFNLKSEIEGGKRRVVLFQAMMEE